MRRWIASLLMSALALGACSGSTDAVSSLAEGRPECQELAGHEITRAIADAGCVIAADKLVSFFTVETCTDGRQLAYNHFGWGFIGSALTEYGPALDAAPPSEALQRCGPTSSSAGGG
jgi:hypothetical protein